MKKLIFWIVQLDLLFQAYTQKCENDCLNKGDCKVDILSIDNESWYYLFNTKKTWHETAKLCEAQGLSMVKMSKELMDIKFTESSLFRDFPPDEYVWLGAAAKDLSNWTFVNGIPLEKKYANALSKNQDGRQSFLCGTVTSTIDDISVERDDCSSKHYFICRFGEWEDTPSFYVSETPATWFNARSRCNDLGGDLFYLNEGENLKFLEKKIKEYTNQRLFIGATVRNWQWEDGQDVLHYNWMTNEPNVYAEKCIAMHPEGGRWFNMECSSKMHVFCQGEACVESTLHNVTETCTKCDKSGLIAGVVILVILVVPGFISMTYIAWNHWKNRKPSKATQWDDNPTKSEGAEEILLQKNRNSGMSIDSDMMVKKEIENSLSKLIGSMDEVSKPKEWAETAMVDENNSMITVKLAGIKRLSKISGKSFEDVKLDVSFTKKQLELHVILEEASKNPVEYVYKHMGLSNVDPASLVLLFGAGAFVLHCKKNKKKDIE